MTDAERWKTEDWSEEINLVKSKHMPQHDRSEAFDRLRDSLLHVYKSISRMYGTYLRQNGEDVAGLMDYLLHRCCLKFKGDNRKGNFANYLSKSAKRFVQFMKRKQQRREEIQPLIDPDRSGLFGSRFPGIADAEAMIWVRQVRENLTPIQRKLLDMRMEGVYWKGIQDRTLYSISEARSILRDVGQTVRRMMEVEA